MDQIKDDIMKGPPSFYEADVQNYMRKFDNSIEQRAEYKERMKKLMQFTDPEKNINVESRKPDEKSRTSLLPSYSKNRGKDSRNMPLK